MKATKRKAWLIVSAIACLGFVFCVSMVNYPEERLSAEQVTELRDQYPVCGKKVPEMITLGANVLEGSSSKTDLKAETLSRR